jgi:hypothetical protein
MKVTTCPEAFAEGQTVSQKYPRTQGAYKLAERQWKENEREVVRIARTVTRPSAKYDLSHCTL